MARYTDANDWYGCTEFEGILFAMTADEKVVVVDVLPAAVEATADEKASAVDVHPAIKVTTIMETEYYSEEDTGLWQHFFDVYLDNIPVTLNLAAFGRQIKEIVRFS